MSSRSRRASSRFYDSFEADLRPTLAVVCFALGTWVGGLYTISSCRHLAAKGYPITVVAPGNHKDEILRVVEGLGAAFEQVVLLGYPPFLKDVIDTGRARGVPWARYRLRICTVGEVFSEEWRALVLERVGSTDLCRDAASLYGTADAGVLGNETPLSVSIRRFLADHPEAARALFGEARLPTLVQYDPLSRYFEVSEGTLLFTGDNGVPLIRYHIADEGGLIDYPAMLAFSPGMVLIPGRVWETARAARGRYPSSMSSGARISWCRTSGPTCTPRTSRSAWSSQRSGNGSRASS